MARIEFQEAPVYSKARVAGHPLHPMLVAFPIAGYTGTLVGLIVYAVRDGQFWLNFSILMNVVGVAGAVLAALPGLVDLAAGIPKGHPAKRVGMRHAALNVLSLALFAIVLGVYASHWNGPARSATLGITLAAIGVASMLAAGFLGWSLVQDHHVGVRSDAERGGTEWSADVHGAHQSHRR
ncbi:hypothetical protein B4N89_41965 [Embleya scabrispora]|uniref:DUF2231 domain-containing protein n=1 Tax=Embleya scabrispora TaxID=159449 RepID=A0A1T3NJV3_9ACTN|nr:DUF2231 domain-containing protein [Embleya scabrispora]OPC77129.1 hypothetical protein B4N89_41965 [Embleya scabrispora]